MPGGKRLTHRAEAAIAALLTEATMEAAAAKAGVSPRTLRYWMKRPAFAAAYNEARQELVDATLRSLQRIGAKAVEALERNLVGKPAIEVRSASVILDRLIRLAEVVGLAEEVADLRRRLNEAKP